MAFSFDTSTMDFSGVDNFGSAVDRTSSFSFSPEDTSKSEDDNWSWGGLAGGFLGGAAGTLFGGPYGGMAGAKLGYQAGDYIANADWSWQGGDGPAPGNSAGREASDFAARNTRFGMPERPVENYGSLEEIRRAAARDAYIAARDEILRNPLQQFGQQVVPDFSADSLAAFDQIRSAANQAPQFYGLDRLQQNAAGQASPFINDPSAVAGGGHLASVAGGSFLGANPYFQAAMDASFRPALRAYQTGTAPQIDNEAARLGRYGSGAHANAVNQGQDMFARALAEASANTAFNMYNAERASQDNAAARLFGAATDAFANDRAREQSAAAQMLVASPQLAAMQYAPANALASIGATQEQRQAAQLLDQREQFDRAQREPIERIGDFTRVFAGIPDTPQEPKQDRFAGFLGGSLAGGATGYQIGGPWGGLIGGIGGGLLGAR